MVVPPRWVLRTELPGYLWPETWLGGNTCPGTGPCYSMPCTTMLYYMIPYRSLSFHNMMCYTHWTLENNRHIRLVLDMYWTCTGHVVDMSRKYVAHVLRICSTCFGHALHLFYIITWTCFEVLSTCFGHVLNMPWTCFGYALVVLLGCFVNVVCTCLGCAF